MKTTDPKEKMLNEIARTNANGAFIVPEGIEIITGDVTYPSDLRKLILPESVKSVERLAFQGCTTLESVEGGNISKIGAYSFSGCTSLNRFDFVHNCEIGNGAFSECAFTNLSFENCKLQSKAFESCKRLKCVIMDESTTAEYDTFDECTAIESFIYSGKEYEAFCIKGTCLIIKERYIVDGIDVIEAMRPDDLSNPTTRIFVCSKDGVWESDNNIRGCIRKLERKIGISSLYSE